MLISIWLLVMLESVGCFLCVGWCGVVLLLAVFDLGVDCQCAVGCGCGLVLWLVACWLLLYCVSDCLFDLV